MASIVKVDTGVCRVRTQVLDSRDESVALILKSIATLNSDHLFWVSVEVCVPIIFEDVGNQCGDVEHVDKAITYRLTVALVILTK
tara:strand:- start:326 stop:580 length:255 start_codon:yes stop_codon:yes gene_type:complete